MASSSLTGGSSLHGSSVTEKLGKSNHGMWKAQVRTAIRGACLQHHLSSDAKVPDTEIVIQVDGKDLKKPNPAHEQWEAEDQQVLSYLLSSISKDVLTQVVSSETAAQAWKTIESMFASQSRAQVVNTRQALSTTKKGNSSVTEYFSKMIALGDGMAAVGRLLEDNELVEYILTGLDEDFAPLVSVLVAMVEPISLDDL
ncbi:unnamed protein product [Urochloa humidicola]